MPKDNQVDEINALLGHERSMADMKTSVSPGPTNRSKMNNMGLDSSSFMPAESNYAAHVQSYRDEESTLGTMISPDIRLKNKLNGDTVSNAEGRGRKAVKYDEYEDLLNTIE